MQAKELAGEAATILELDLHKATVQDLDFSSSFSTTWSGSNEFDTLEGFVIWFDTPFSPDSAAKEVSKDWLNLSTSPSGTPTHWQQGVLLVQEPSRKVKEGEKVEGTVSYKKRVDTRGMDIVVQWGEAKQEKQSWKIE